METIDAQDVKVQGEDDSPIHGDLLEVVLARVPLVDLACASRVSKSWEFAILSSLSHISKIKPWLVIHTQCKRSLKKKTTFAYDPRSNMWIEISQPQSTATRFIPVVQSSCSSLLYELSPNRLSFSVDPLHLTWHYIPPPRAWRVDPIVARVGSHIIVAGGASGFYEDPLSVEMYDMETSHWSTCQPMPDILKHSAASTWLCVASNQESMYVMEKASGVLYSFSPETQSWGGPYDLRPDPGVFFSAVGFAGDDFILAGVVGHSENVETLKIWKIMPESMEFDEIGKIPTDSNPEEIIFCEFADDGGWKWGSVKNVVLNDERRIGERMVMSCGKVGIGDVQIAMKARNLKLLL
ncbi:hypothetical protein Cgig2_018258 [Carnegiea gigantea]|uniref:F-box domain-containing protein n=1 Tax=Carnegiea gigantea TaxID=171969 RepID=A0A9Q1KXQ9_9CARY|nr:hypothetical protein Cgig2_018258 [Carnegiea gigantea]